MLHLSARCRVIRFWVVGSTNRRAPNVDYIISGNLVSLCLFSSSLLRLYRHHHLLLLCSLFILVLLGSMSEVSAYCVTTGTKLSGTLDKTRLALGEDGFATHHPKVVRCAIDQYKTSSILFLI